MGKVMIEGYKCERCGYTWVKRKRHKEGIINVTKAAVRKYTLIRTARAKAVNTFL
jgi:hypothetical protein